MVNKKGCKTSLDFQYGLGAWILYRDHWELMEFSRLLGSSFLRVRALETVMLLPIIVWFRL